MTYLKMRSRDADTPARWVGAMQSTNVGFTSTVIPFGAPSIDDLGLGSGVALTTPAGVTGWYTIWISFIPAVANVEHWDYRFYIGGAIVQQGSRSFNTNGTPAGGQNGVDGIYYAATLGPSLQIQLQANNPAGATYNLAPATVEITYVPVPNHRYA